jgi:hypothetical protein
MKVIDFVNKVKHYMESAGYRCLYWHYHGYDDPDIASQLEVEDSFENSFDYGYKLGTYDNKLNVLIGDVDFTFDDVIASRKNYSFEESILVIFRRCVLNTILDIGWVKTFTAYINGYYTASTSNRSHMMFTMTVRIINKCDAEALRTLLNTNWDDLSVMWYEETNAFCRMSHADATEYFALYNHTINDALLDNWNNIITSFDNNNAIECKAIFIKWRHDKCGEEESEDMSL